VKSFSFYFMRAGLSKNNGFSDLDFSYLHINTLN
jgi:hypothetical protein